MIVDILALQSFYETPLGRTAQRFVGRALVDFLRGVKDARVLGLGYCPPYLRPALARAERVNLLMPARQGVGHWPSETANLAFLADPLMLPLPDAAYDRAIVAHLLETTEDPDELLHELWRTLAPGGRVAIVTPNRRGVWARVDATPFGQGRPYSRSQLADLLARNSFAAEKWTEALYVPPIASDAFLRTAGAWERFGTRLSAPFAGIIVVEAVKQAPRPIPARVARRRLTFAPALSPSPAPAAAPAPLVPGTRLRAGAGNRASPALSIGDEETPRSG
ncbi:MAG: methyltransferase domain-containing protein [Salinarimonadaceae bacterium]|nr:MAG: methyltransferase domain-containing protein [Salinarimonadaceae bacterium]